VVRAVGGSGDGHHVGPGGTRPLDEVVANHIAKKNMARAARGKRRRDERARPGGIDFLVDEPQKPALIRRDSELAVDLRRQDVHAAALQVHACPAGR
jgi:hypothetical protein